MATIERPLVRTLLKRLEAPIQPIQVVLGPRQVGKTTAVEQVLAKWKGPSHYATADLPAPPDAHWVETQWRVARQLAQAQRKRTLLVLDEVQKVPRWSEVVKAMYDEDKRKKALVRAVVLGSSALHVARGAQESLAGRFEVHFCPHWTFSECRDAFGWSLEEWLFFGGYPGAAPLVRDLRRWRRFISDALIESALSRDVLQLNPVSKPALLRQLFVLAAHLPAQIVAYNKMLGQLQDAGNATTLAHYADLLSASFLITGLKVWSGGALRMRASKPKFVVWNNAIVSALMDLSLAEARRNGDLWGRLVENAVGAHFLNAGMQQKTFYWQEGNAELDFVVESGRSAVAFEVKSGRRSASASLELFRKRHPKIPIVSVGTGGVPLEQFFSNAPEAWL